MNANIFPLSVESRCRTSKFSLNFTIFHYRSCDSVMVAKQNTTATREKEHFERVLFFHLPSSRGRKTRVAGCSGFYECSSLDNICAKQGKCAVSRRFTEPSFRFSVYRNSTNRKRCRAYFFSCEEAWNSPDKIMERALYRSAYPKSTMNASER